MSAYHIFRFLDAAETTAEKYPLCGQANAHGGIVLKASDVGNVDLRDRNVTCKRCIKAYTEKGLGL